MGADFGSVTSAKRDQVLSLLHLKHENMHQCLVCCRSSMCSPLSGSITVEAILVSATPPTPVSFLSPQLKQLSSVNISLLDKHAPCTHDSPSQKKHEGSINSLLLNSPCVLITAPLPLVNAKVKSHGEMHVVATQHQDFQHQLDVSEGRQ